MAEGGALLKALCHYSTEQMLPQVELSTQELYVLEY